MLKKIHKKAFSLIELSIVLVIVSILIAGTLSVSVTGINNAKIKVTNDRIQAIYKALGTYLSSHYSLPCPASLYALKTLSGYGAAVGSNGTCRTGSGDGVLASNLDNNVYYGAVPVHNLGLPDDFAEDGFGSKFAYIVTGKMTIAEYPNTTNNSGFSFNALTGTNVFDVIDISSGNAVEQNIVAIISFGINKYGAFNANSSAQNSASTDSYEAQNYPTSIFHGSVNTANFGQNSYDASRVVLTGSNPVSDVFDDIVFAKTRTQLVNDFNLQFLIPCAAQTVNSKTYSATYYGMLQYGSASCSNPSTAKPSYRCGPNGTWVLVDSCAVY